MEYPENLAKYFHGDVSYISYGPIGQHAGIIPLVIIKHIGSGFMEACVSERNHHENRILALKRLYSRLKEDGRFPFDDLQGSDLGKPLDQEIYL